MPSDDRQIAYPLPVGGRLRSGLSILFLAVGLLVFGMASVAHGPAVVFGASLAVVTVLGLLGLVGEEQRRPPGRGPASERAAQRTSAPERPADDAVEVLKRRYAAGELSDEELDRRVERLVALDGLDDADREPEAERARS